MKQTKQNKRKKEKKKKTRNTKKGKENKHGLPPSSAWFIVFNLTIGEVLYQIVDFARSRYHALPTMGLDCESL